MIYVRRVRLCAPGRSIVRKSQLLHSLQTRRLWLWVLPTALLNSTNSAMCLIRITQIWWRGSLRSTHSLTTGALQMFPASSSIQLLAHSSPPPTLASLSSSDSQSEVLVTTRSPTRDRQGFQVTRDVMRPEKNEIIDIDCSPVEVSE